jgi:hypothetical protein
MYYIFLAKPKQVFNPLLNKFSSSFKKVFFREIDNIFVVGYYWIYFIISNFYCYF